MTVAPPISKDHTTSVTTNGILAGTAAHDVCCPYQATECVPVNQRRRAGDAAVRMFCGSFMGPPHSGIGLCLTG